MKFYSDDIVQLVRGDRKKGFSIKKLQEKYNIPSTTLSRWLRDINSEATSFKQARIKENILKKKYQNILKDLNVDSDYAKLLVSILYWCEGSKHPAVNFIAFANSDQNLVLTFLKLLRKGFTIKEKKLKVHLQIHSTHSFIKIKKYWSNLLKIPESQFYKPTVTNPTKNMKRRNYYGTCTIKYYDVKLLLQITGLYEQFSNKVTNWRGG